MTDVIDITFVTKTEQLDKAFQKAGRLEKQIQRLAAAEAKGQITHKQYTAQVNKLASELQKVSGGSIQARNAVMAYSRTTREAAKVQAQFAAAAQASQKAMHRKGVVMQQAGYQVGDFLVQVQSGTNAFVAFGQQATQLVGVMGMLNPKWIKLSAGLGIALPLLTAVGAYFMRTRESAKTLDDALSDLESSVSQVSQTVDTLLDKDLESQFGQFSDSVRDLSESFVALDEAAAVRNFKDTLESIKSTAEGGYLDRLIFGFKSALVAGVGGGSMEGFEQSQFDKLGFGGSIRDFEDALTRMSMAGQAGDVDAVARSFKAYIDIATNGGTEINKISNEGLALLFQQRDIALAIARIRASVLEPERQKSDLINQQVALFDKMNLQLLQQRDLQEKIREYGEDSFEVNNLRVEQSIDAYNQQVEKLVEAGKLTSEQGQTLKVVNADLERSTQVTTAFRDVLSEVASVMGTVADEASRVNSNLGGRSAGRGGPTAGEINRYDFRAQLAAQANWTPPKTRGGGGKSEAERLADRIAKFEEQLALEKKLVGVSEARARILKALGADFVENNPKIVEGYEAQIEAVEKLKEQEAGLKSFAETLQSSLGDAFMSIVDGSKSAADAFKDMARMVIKKALELTVINPLLNMLFGGMGLPLLPTAPFAKGGVFSNGNVTAFADGGVVGGPTYFPMSGGRTGLMGEAGPEAIMPLKRGPDGKLGVQSSGSNITVNQTINVSTGVQQTVRTEVKSLMPQIADAAKAAVVDARRRGEMGMA